MDTGRFLLLAGFACLASCQLASSPETCTHDDDCRRSEQCTQGACVTTSEVEKAPSASSSASPDEDGGVRGDGSIWSQDVQHTASRTLSCYQVQTCNWLHCKNEPGRSCSQQFFQRATPEAVGEFQQFRSCTRRTGCQTGVVTQCARRQCSPQLEGCFELEAEGSLKCSQVVQCLYECEDDDSRCRTKCVERASSTAEKRYMAFVRCSQACKEGLNSEKGRRCIRSTCMEAFEGCFQCGVGATSEDVDEGPPSDEEPGEGKDPPKNGASSGKGNGNGEGASPGKGKGDGSPPGEGENSPPGEGRGNDSPPGSPLGT